MSERPPAGACVWQGRDLLLRVHVQPRAGRDAIVGWHGDALKVRIQAPPVDGRANGHLVRFLAGVFDVPRARIEVLSGQTGRKKRVRIQSPGRLPPGIPEDG